MSREGGRTPSELKVAVLLDASTYKTLIGYLDPDQLFVSDAETKYKLGMTKQSQLLQLEKRG